MSATRIVILSNNVFTATSMDAFDGFVAIKGNVIEAVGPRAAADAYVAHADRIIEVGERTVMPGMTDVHTFFSGWALLSLGCDLSRASNDEEGLSTFLQYAQGQHEESPLFGHGWKNELFSSDAEKKLTSCFPSRPVVAFTADRGTCWMNECARERYKFTPEECYAEKIWRMMGDYLPTDESRTLYLEYMKMLNRRGITQIKEMTFDDYYGFMDTMTELEEEGKLTLRVSMMSQPVGCGIDIEHGRKMRKRFRGPFVNFSGFNRMTDRSIASGMAELKEPYKSNPTTCCTVPVEWDLIERELAEADEAGFRYSLHCQGDAAVAHVVDLYEKCRHDAHGRLVNRHAITDLELSDPEDLIRLGCIGGICEIYPQIQSLDDSNDLIHMVNAQIGSKRFEHYWMRRTMWDSGCVVCAGTDLPLMLPSIGEAIYCSCGGYMNDGVIVRQENTLSSSEMLLAWTRNGSYDCYNEARVGTLEPGKLADVVVLEADVVHGDPATMRDVNAALTISDGRVVYDELV